VIIAGNRVARRGTVAAVGVQGYRTVLGIRDARRVLVLGLVVRIPLWAANVVLVLHVVSHLHRSYGQAGFLSGVATVALAVSAPWRGRRLDRVGLRRAVAPSIAVLAACWSIAPFVGYWPLLVLGAFGDLFAIPSFTIVRQSLLHNVPEGQRTAALSIDSVGTEISFMIGPPVGVLLATAVPTPWALFGCQFASIAGGVLIWLADPALRPESSEPHARVARRRWLTPTVIAVLAASMAATIVLTGTDVGVVAALRHMHHQSWIGWALAIWGLGSAIGGFVYGALHRTVPAVVLLGLLAATTMPVGLSPNPGVLAALLLVTGFFCAPTITATVDALSRLVPAHIRGEALGWHGSALTAGGALGAPLAGIAIDRYGWPAGFVAAGAAGLAAAIGLLVVTQARHEPETAADAPVPAAEKSDTAV
jgi:MFS family permease